MKIVVNKCFGGFGLSNKATKRYLELKGKECYFYTQTGYTSHDGEMIYKITDENSDDMLTHCSTKYLGDEINDIPDEYGFYYWKIDRTDEDLIKVIEELDANGRCANLEVIEIPDDVEWEIDEYDGIETIHEVHRRW